jgi:hypothetical protein
MELKDVLLQPKESVEKTPTREPGECPNCDCDCVEEDDHRMEGKQWWHEFVEYGHTVYYKCCGCGHEWAEHYKMIHSGFSDGS